MRKSYMLGAAILLFGLAFNLGRSSPVYGWDVLPYAAIAISMWNDKDFKEIHSQTYHLAQEVLPQERYAEFTGGHYRSAMAEHPDYFWQQLPFYTVKPFYPAAIALTSRLGINEIDASILLVRVAYVGLGLLLFIWLASIVPPVSAGIIS